jgi:flagellar basal body L-ring protein FlgH
MSETNEIPNSERVSPTEASKTFSQRVSGRVEKGLKYGTLALAGLAGVTGNAEWAALATTSGLVYASTAFWNRVAP